MGRSKSSKPKKVGTRVVIALLGFSAIGLGISPMLRGDLFYDNWFHGFVFAPIAIVGGIAMILMAIFKPKFLF